MFDPTLRTPVVYAIAVRYQTPLWRAGAMLRAGCIAGFWVLLWWFPHHTWLKDAALLALGSIGAVTAWAHNRSSLLDALAERHVIGLGTAARHLRRVRDRATVDLSGLLEGLGIVCAACCWRACCWRARSRSARCPPRCTRWAWCWSSCTYGARSCRP